MNDVVVGKTASKVVLGVLNEYAYRMVGQHHGDPVKLSLQLAGTPLFASTPRVLRPISATLAALAAPRGLSLAQ